MSWTYDSGGPAADTGVIAVSQGPNLPPAIFLPTTNNNGEWGNYVQSTPQQFYSRVPSLTGSTKGQFPQVSYTSTASSSKNWWDILSGMVPIVGSGNNGRGGSIMGIDNKYLGLAVTGVGTYMACRKRSNKIIGTAMSGAGIYLSGLGNQISTKFPNTPLINNPVAASLIAGIGIVAVAKSLGLIRPAYRKFRRFKSRRRVIIRNRYFRSRR